MNLNLLSVVDGCCRLLSVFSRTEKSNLLKDKKTVCIATVSGHLEIVRALLRHSTKGFELRLTYIYCTVVKFQKFPTLKSKLFHKYY